MGSQPLPDLFISLQVPPFRASISRDRLKLIDKVSGFDTLILKKKKGKSMITFAILGHGGINVLNIVKVCLMKPF